MFKFNFNEFYSNIDKNIKKKQEKAKKVIKNTALNFLEEVQKESPVDTGRYKAGHVLSKNSPSNFVPNKNAGDFSGQASKNKFEAEGILENIKEGERANIYVTNNVEYADVIEHGGRNRSPNLVYEKVRMKNEKFYNDEKKKEGL